MRDHFLPYRRLDTVDHAFCNADILREPNSLIEFDKEVWAELMRDMLLAANLAVNKAREAGAAGLAPAELKAFLERYWAAVRLGLAFHCDLPKLATKAAPGRVKHRPGHNLLQRLKTFQTETLRFLTDFDAPFTDNLAGQDLRMMKVKMKISGSFRTLEGAQIFATLRSEVVRHALQRRRLRNRSEDKSSRVRILEVGRSSSASVAGRVIQTPSLSRPAE